MDQIKPISTKISQQIHDYMNEINYSWLRIQNLMGIPADRIGEPNSSSHSYGIDAAYKKAMKNMEASVLRTTIKVGNMFMTRHILREAAKRDKFRLPRKIKKEVKKHFPGKINRLELKFYFEVFKTARYYGGKIIKEK